MYGYEWTSEYGIFRLTVEAKIQKEIRPVFHEELDFFGMDEYWSYPKDTDAPLLWAEGIRRYVLNGECVAEAEGGGFYTKPKIKLLTKKKLKLKPIDVDRLYEVNRKYMVSLEQKSISFIREQHENYFEQGFSFVCAFSGGKDSLVLLDLTAKALAPKDFYVVFSNTGMELSDTLNAVEKAKKQWPALRFEEAKSHMLPEESWKEFGPPASKLRWCCSVHKSVPTVLLMKKIAKDKVVVFDGVRAEESARRAKYSEVAEGVKNSMQVNCHAILKWSSSEVFIYLLKSGIMLNDAYKHGIYRVGCKVCPMSSKWQDSLIAFNYPDEIKSSLAVLEEITRYAKGRLDRQYIEDGKWQSRVGGRILKQGENRVNEYVENDRLIFEINNSKLKMESALPIIGNVVETDIKSSKKHYVVKTKCGLVMVDYTFRKGKQKVIVYPFFLLDRYVISAFRNIVNKTAYCIGCKACVPQCPTGAFLIIDGKIQIREKSCVHCYNCCTYTDRGCMVAKSLYVRSDDMKNPDKYRNFGFRQAFYEHFVSNGVACFEMGVLGKDQYTSLKQWLADAGVLVVETKETSGKINTRILKKTTNLADKLIQFGAYNPFPWAIMWANLCYNSVITRFFCFQVSSGETFDKDILVDGLNSGIDQKYRSQAVNSLLSTFRDSPIGSSLKQGIPVDKSYLRDGWDYPDAIALLYSLYLYAEKTGRRTFSFTELVNSHNNPDAKGISPHDIYGIEVKDFREKIQGLAVAYPKFIRVSFVANIDNIILEDYSSEDIIDIAEDDN